MIQFVRWCHVQNYYNVSNSNFFAVRVMSLEASMRFAQTMVASATNASELVVPMRSSAQYEVTFNATFTDEFAVFVFLTEFFFFGVDGGPTVT